MDQPKTTFTRLMIKKRYQEELGLSVKESSQLLEAVIQSTLYLLKNTEKSLKISSFGTFLIHHKGERLGRNPQTKEEKTILPRRSISFRASETLKKNINDCA